MSPVGKPDADGDIVRGSRHYHGRTLGPTTVWDCPACGMKNEGRPPEQGCAHCGAGDPTRSKAGAAPTATPPPAPPRRPGDNIRDRDPLGAALADELVQPSKEWAGFEKPAATIRVLRLIEYLIKPGENADITLRRSLVGRMDMSWGTLTGTIVDSCDDRQEDLLRLARRQPGVWVTNSAAMEQADQQDRGRRPVTSFTFVPPPGPDGVPGTIFNPFADAAKERERKSMDMPDTGPAFTENDQAIGTNILRLWGPKLAYTLALALAQIAPELDGSAEREKFLSSTEALGLANALMQAIPSDWLGDTDDEVAPPTGDPGADEARRQEVLDRVRTGSVPTVVYRDVKEGDKPLL